MPHRIITIVEGESLINDGTALVAYKFAVAAVVTGSFSLLEASGEFVVSAVGGIAVGIVVGAIVAAVRRRLDNPPVEITIALATSYFAYLPAEAIGVSGVLAAVTVGIYMGRLTSELTTPTTRIQGNARLGDPRLPPQLGALRPDRPPAPADRRRPRRRSARAS